MTGIHPFLGAGTLAGLTRLQYLVMLSMTQHDSFQHPDSEGVCRPRIDAIQMKGGRIVCTPAPGISQEQIDQCTSMARASIKLWAQGEILCFSTGNPLVKDTSPRSMRRDLAQRLLNHFGTPEIAWDHFEIHGDVYAKGHLKWLDDRREGRGYGREDHPDVFLIKALYASMIKDALGNASSDLANKSDLPSA